MDERKPYDPYGPNCPAPDTDRKNRRASPYARPPAEEPPVSVRPQDEQESPIDVWGNPVPPDRSYAQLTWDEEEYPESKPENLPKNARRPAGRTEAEAPESRETGGENPNIRPTWDESTYPDRKAGETGAAPERRGRAAALHFDADADTSPNTAYARPEETQSGPAPLNPYARPASAPEETAGEASERFAPPLRYVLPNDEYLTPIPIETPAEPPQPNIYRRRDPFAETPGDEAAQPRGAHAYHVETDGPSAALGKKRHTLRRWLIALCILAVLAAAAYVERDWLMKQVDRLLGTEMSQTAGQAAGNASRQVTGYDPAPVLQASDRAKKGIAAVSGDVELQSYAVTNRNVVGRVALGNGLYDYYLFASADGKLLGYYDALPEDGFLVCPDDVFYVAMPPYLIDENGRALIDTTRYLKSVGDDPVLGPMIGGWALISNRDHTTFNYINAEGAALSTLWFSKAYPFTADSTVAYVDTGNVTNPGERYALYELTKSGGATMWRHTADMSAVLGCACGIVQMDDGEMILLDGHQTVLCTTDDVSVYADCGAIVARDPETGKYGLFVNGDPFYDFAYDSIAPVETAEISWREEQNGFYRLYTVEGMAYPLPLSHYFRLEKGGEEELVALSTGSVYPLLLSLQE
jgi:hypothetical protein